VTDAPYGWRRTENGGMVPNEIERNFAFWIRSARPRFASDEQMADALNKLNMPPREGEWTAEKVAEIMGRKNGHSM